MSLAAGEAPVDAQGRVAARDLRYQELPASPGADPLAAFAAAPPSRRRFCWIQPERGLTLVGIGAALQWRPASRARRFDEATRFVSEAAPHLREFGERSEPGSPGAPAGPILCGGFAFDSEPDADQSRWTGFGAGMLMVPELLGIAAQGRARWIVTAPADLLAEASRRAVELLQSTAGTVPAPCPLVLLGPTGGADDAGYLATVDAALEQIRTGAFGKVVPARQVTARLAGSPGGAAPAELLRRLAIGYPTATTFALSCGDRTLLGATPELLIRIGNGIAETDALAGSCPRGGNPAEDAARARAMLASRKERHEHDTVVEHLRNAMTGSGVVLDPCPPEPYVRALPAIQHLCTPVRGRLPTAPGAILELAGALHPTPAVAGQPVGAALEFLRCHEPAGRGWFAGPVGWTDLEGNGEFCLALRSGLLDPDSNEIALFAGSGVVAGSDPAAELRETASKLQALPAVTDDAPLGGVYRQ